MAFHGVSWFLFLKHLLKFHVISMISWNVLMCHCIAVYCIKMLQWYLNIYWYEDSWFSIQEMVHDMVALQEWYGIMTDDIQRIDWYVGIVYVKLQALSFDILFMWDHGSLGESP